MNAFLPRHHLVGKLAPTQIQRNSPSRSLLRANAEEPDLLGEQIKELVEGMEKFQADAYNSLYGKEVS